MKLIYKIFFVLALVRIFILVFRQSKETGLTKKIVKSFRVAFVTTLVAHGLLGNSINAQALPNINQLNNSPSQIERPFSSFREENGNQEVKVIGGLERLENHSKSSLEIVGGADESYQSAQTNPKMEKLKRSMVAKSP